MDAWIPVLLAYCSVTHRSLVLLLDFFFFFVLRDYSESNVESILSTPFFSGVLISWSRSFAI